MASRRKIQYDDYRVAVQQVMPLYLMYRAVDGS